MTYGEVVDIIKARRKKEVEDRKFQAMLAYQLGELVAAGVGIALGSKQSFPTIQDVFPGVFEESRPKKQPWQITNERITAYAAQKRKQNGGGQE
jgi:hypothetical protein